jgi:hypothetical protein
MDPNALATLERTLSDCIAIAVDLMGIEPRADRALRLAQAFMLSAHDEIRALQVPDRQRAAGTR